jgi:hypothetical protein
MCTNLACCSFERDHEGQPAAFFPVRAAHCGHETDP